MWVGQLQLSQLRLVFVDNAEYPMSSQKYCHPHPTPTHIQDLNSILLEYDSCIVFYVMDACSFIFKLVFYFSNVYPYTWSNNWEAGRGKRPAQFADEGYKVS